MAEQHQVPMGRTRHGQFTLDQIAEMQPGLGTLMPQVSDRYWIMYYAAKEGNWPLARHQLHELEGLLRLGATTRPRMAQRLDAFIQGAIAGINRAIEQKDFFDFQMAYERGIQEANQDHKETGHQEIVWQLPKDPPQHLVLKPPQS